MRLLCESVFVPPAASVIAGRRGFFAKHGLEVVQSPVASSRQQLEELMTGRADVAVTATDNLLVWNGSGADLAVVGQVDATTDLVLLLRPGLIRPEDVGVLRLAVDARTNGFAVVAYSLMEHLGRDRSAYEVLEVGGVSQRFEALVDGTADATLVAAPLDEIGQSQGMVAFMRVRDIVSAYPGLAIVARRSDLDRSVADVASYLAALEEAVHWCRAAPLIDVGAELGSAGFGPSAVKAVLATLPPSVAPSDGGFGQLSELRRRVGMTIPGAPDPNRLIDTRPAAAAGLLTHDQGELNV